MKHSVLIQNGRAHEIWRGGKKRLEKLFHPDLLAQVVEVEGAVSLGDLWDGAVFTSPPPPDTSIDVRAERDRLLAASDWSQLPDAPVDREAWASYRQALRDVTAQPGFPGQVEWPARPSDRR